MHGLGGRASTDGAVHGPGVEAGRGPLIECGAGL